MIDATGNTVITVGDASKYLRAVEKEEKKGKSKKRKAPPTDSENHQESRPRQGNTIDPHRRRDSQQPLARSHNYREEAAHDGGRSLQNSFDRRSAIPHNASSSPLEGDEDKMRDEEDWGHWMDANGFERARPSTRAPYRGRSMLPHLDSRHPTPRQLAPLNEEEEYQEYNGTYSRQTNPERRHESRVPRSRYHDDHGHERSPRRDHRPHERGSSRQSSARSDGPMAKKRKLQEVDDHTPRQIAPVPRRAHSGSRAPQNAIAGPSRRRQTGELDNENQEEDY